MGRPEREPFMPCLTKSNPWKLKNEKSVFFSFMQKKLPYSNNTQILPLVIDVQSLYLYGGMIWLLDFSGHCSFPTASSGMDACG